MPVANSGKPSILVVDDEEALRALLCHLLAREGFEPIPAADGEQAIEIYRQAKPMIVLSDIMMPKLDGLGLLAEIRRIDRTAIVILMTGQGNEEVLLKALRGGATNFFKKPFNVRELIEEIRTVVELRTEVARASLFTPCLVEETKSFLLPRSDTPYLPVVNQVTLQLPLLLPEGEILNIKVGIEEMITNAIEHGNLGVSFEEKNAAITAGTLSQLEAERARESDAAGRAVRITSRLTPALFEVTIRDDGRGFDWRTLPDVIAENILGLNGRGIFLTKIYFDEVIFNDAGNEVTLRKRRRA